jgi:capsular exopolysaccharide synthesis family protein
VSRPNQMRTAADKTSSKGSSRTELDAIERDILGRPRRAAGAGRGVVLQTEPPGATLEAVLRVLRRRWLIVVACTVTATAVALIVSHSQDKQYESSTNLLFRSATLGNGVFDASSTKPADVDRAAVTNVDLAELRVVAERTAKRLHQPGISGADVAAAVDLSAKRDSDLAKIKAKTGSPVLSSSMANTYATEYIAFRRQVDRASVHAARTALNRQLAQLTKRQRSGREGKRLRSVIRQLQVAEALRTGGAELVQHATPATNPVSPRPKRDAVIGLLLGLMLGVSLALLREALDRRLNDETDVERALGLPILARIPGTRTIWKTDTTAGSTAETDAFRMLRANVRYHGGEREIRSLLVTSALRGEGKTAVAWNLALAEAHAGRHVVLIETDLRAGGLAKRLKLPHSDGLNLLLAGAASIEECSVTVTTPTGRLDIVLSGPSPRNPAALLESHAMESLIDDLSRHYDVVILDAAPASIVSDTAPLMSLVDGVLVVVRLGQTKSDAAAGLRRQLDKLGAPVIGAVVNEGGGGP